MRSDVGAAETMTCDFDGTIQQAGLSFVRDSIVPSPRVFQAIRLGIFFIPFSRRAMLRR